MTKQEVLNEIDALCSDIDNCTTEITKARCQHDKGRISNAHWAMESILVAAYQQLDFIGNFIDKNIKDE